MLGGVWTGILYFVGFTLLALIGFSIWWNKQFKNRVVIRDVINNRVRVQIDRVRIYKDRNNGGTYWHFKTNRAHISAPPAEAVEIKSDGTFLAEAYRTTTGEYIWIKDRINVSMLEELPEEFNKEEDIEKRQKLISDWRKKRGITNPLEAFQPLTNNQRIIFLQQIKKAQERKSKRWQDMLVPIVSIVSLTVIVICLMIFYGDIAKPVLTAQANQIEYQRLQTEQTKILQEINNHVQSIESETKGGTKIPAAPPN
jgi:hypothetical protein